MNPKQNSGNMFVYLVAGVLIVALLFLGLSGNQVQNIGKQSQQEGQFTAIGYNSMVCKEVIRADGTREGLGCKQNLFTNYGKNITRELLAHPGTAGGNVTYIAVGNATAADQAATNTSLGQEYGANPPAACGLGRAGGTYAKVDTSHGNWSISKVFTASCDSLNVSATGIYNASTGSTLFAETTFTPVTLQNNDQINITWYMWVT